MSDNKTTDTISMHFRHSTTVDELVNKLRAHCVPIMYGTKKTIFRNGLQSR